jgi:hypothetical protein
MRRYQIHGLDLVEDVHLLPFRMYLYGVYGGMACYRETVEDIHSCKSMSFGEGRMACYREVG